MSAQVREKRWLRRLAWESGLLWVVNGLGLWDGGMERFGSVTGVVVPH